LRSAKIDGKSIKMSDADVEIQENSDEYQREGGKGRFAFDGAL
jgi:hypothetical protein